MVPKLSLLHSHSPMKNEQCTLSGKSLSLWQKRLWDLTLNPTWNIWWWKGYLETAGVHIYIYMAETRDEYHPLQRCSLPNPDRLGPTQFAVWWTLQDSATVIQCLDSSFLRGAHLEILTDNDTAFNSRKFRMFAGTWDVSPHFRCTYAPSGNGIV